MEVQPLPLRKRITDIKGGEQGDVAGEDPQLPSGAGQDHLIRAAVENALVGCQNTEIESHGEKVTGRSEAVRRQSGLGVSEDLGGLRPHLIDVTHEIERCLGQIVKLTSKDHVEAIDGVF